MRKIPFAGIELTSQRVRGLRGTSELPGRPAHGKRKTVRRPSDLLIVGNLHTCLCGSREFDSYQSKICVLSFVTVSVGM